MTNYSLARLEKIVAFEMNPDISQKVDWDQITRDLAKRFEDNRDYFEENLEGKFRPNGESWLHKVAQHLSGWPTIIFPTIDLGRDIMNAYVVPRQQEEDKHVRATRTKISFSIEREMNTPHLEECNMAFNALSGRTNNTLEILYGPINEYLRVNYGSEAQLSPTMEVDIKLLASNINIDVSNQDAFIKLNKGLLILTTNNLVEFRNAGCMDAEGKTLQSIYGMSEKLDGRRYEIVGITDSKTSEDLDLNVENIRKAWLLDL